MGVVIPVLIAVAWAAGLLALFRLQRRKGWAPWSGHLVVVVMAIALGIAGVIYKSLR